MRTKTAILSIAVLEFDPSQSHIDDFLRAALKAGFQVL